MQSLNVIPVARWNNLVIRYKDRDIIMVILKDKRQPFYRSTGRNSGLPNEWLPFDGIRCPNTVMEWFDKHAYTVDPEEPRNKYGFGMYHRYGNKYLWDISQELKKLNIPQGIEVESGMDVNLFLGVLDKYANERDRQAWARNKNRRLCSVPNFGTKRKTVVR